MKKLFQRFWISLKEKFWHLPLSILASLIYHPRFSNLTCIAVAGTKGKTTTVHLIAFLLEKFKKKVAFISTAVVKIGEKEELNFLKKTTPSPFFLQKFIRNAIRKNCHYLILEVSSHGLAQFRTWGLPFKAVVLTNLSSDHLEYHHTFSNYKKVHLKLLNKNLKYLILNQDDKNLDEFLKLDEKNFKKITFSLKENQADFLAQNLKFNEKGSSFFLKTKNKKIFIKLPLLGKYNIANSLGAMALLNSLGFDLLEIKKFLTQFKGVPGRLEVFSSPKGFKVIVDFAHSPLSLKNLFSTLKPLKKGRIITVFGACGQRDETQRPLMAEIIDKNSEIFVLTNDDPYKENPEKIASDLMKGIKNKILNKTFFKILNRKEAIKKAISLAQKKDLVLILGKGAEQWQIFKDKKIPWDDRKIVKELIS